MFYKFIGTSYVTFVSNSVSLIELRHFRFHVITRFCQETLVPDISHRIMSVRELTSHCSLQCTTDLCVK
jgi:hypothetical protein